MALREIVAATILTVAAVAFAHERGGSGQSTLDSLSDAEQRSFADAVLQWNGDIFWEPASNSSNIVTRLGDEARAVFGPIPDGDCSDGAAKTIPLEVGGNIVELKPNPEKPGSPLEFEHRDAAGKLVKWTQDIPKCDKPALSGDVTYCGLNSRLNRVVRGNVEWLFFCRKSTDSLELTSDPYWQASNPNFALLGTIGFNGKTGEIVFFDGRKDRTSFDWSEPFGPPGGDSYADLPGRATAEALYDPTFAVRCYACHDNKDALVIDPRVAQARVGYYAGREDLKALAFSLGDYLPKGSRDESDPFRVIGSAFTKKYSADLKRAKTVQDPTGNCTGCHSLTTQITGKRFAADAVAQEPWVSTPTFAQALQLHDEKIKYANVAAHRTDWALRSGAGKIHPWMVPGEGNQLSKILPEMSPEDWRRLSDCLWNAGGRECGYAPLYTACPAPESKALGDPFAPIDITAEVLPAPAESDGRVIRITWKYLNDYGGVPQRDDVRFNVAIKETAIAFGGEAPAASMYPSMEEAAGTKFQSVDREISISGSAMLIANASFAGHERWTDPTEATSPREFSIDLPGRCNRRYLFRLLPKRFCFDQSKIAYSSVDHLLYADVACK